ncbi:MAG: FHA domain-containing protein [Nocardiaceae bacterium]|nr:FHA domain-containing protein [Nocardiaceae bacterium]
MDVRVLGPVRVLAGGRELAIGGRRARIVLALLVVHRRRVVSAETLADAVWGEDPPATYQTSLQVAVSNLRKVLRENGSDADAIRTVAPGYRFDLAEQNCDVGRFEAARTAGVLAAPDAAAGHYRRALAEWSGEVLADLRGLSFADTFAAALDEERWHTLAARVEADIAAGRAKDVIGELTKLTSEHPLREPFWVQLASALYLSGRQSDALDACRRVRRILDDELGVDPGPQLLAVESKILRQEPLDAHIGDRSPARELTVTEAETMAVTSGFLLLADGRRVTASGNVRIGRSPDNDVPLDDRKVSRHHARIFQGPTGLVLRDLESTNGVYLNGERVSGDALLVNGAEIRIGAMTMVFESN